MALDWLIEVLKGIGKFFLNPLFYYLFFIAAVLGVSRVKRERSNFSVRAENAYFELRQLLPLGIVVGLGLSVITLWAGIAVPIETLLFTAVLTFVLSISMKVSLLAPVYTLGFAFFATILAAQQKWPLPSIYSSISDSNQIIFPSIAVLLALLIIGEGILILKNGKKGTSPKLVKSKRGQNVGLHEVKRLWMVPMFLLVPGEAIQLAIDWWPVFSIGGNEYSIVLIPFAVGFAQRIQGNLPADSVKALGKRVIAFGIFITLLSISGYWYPLASVGVVGLAILGRAFISMRQRMADRNLPFYFSKRNQGLMILGVIPESPASKMALQVGEIVTKINGMKVHDEKGLYEALQKNGAHCKLEVLDVNGQVRFVQRALYEGDHHELGILFVQDEKKWDSEAM